MITPIILFLVGLVLLIKGGDWFVDGATGIAHKFHVPDLLIGATVVSIGTTLPEVMVSATSAVSGHGEIAYGNAIGSIICNTALIAAISIAVKPSRVDKKTLTIPVIFFYVSTALYLFTAYVTKRFARVSGVLLLLIFVAYIGIQVYQAMHGKNPEAAAADAEVTEVAAAEADTASNSAGKDLLLLVIGAAFIAIGANLLVDNGIIIAGLLGVPESVIALTFVALGTSLPELVTAITSLRKGHGLLSLGNIIGANLFNLVLVSGVSILLSPFDLPNSKQIGAYNASLVVDIPVMLGVMLILTIPPLIKGKMTRLQGIILLAIYAAFCIFQFAL